MSMQTIAAIHSTFPRELAPTLANSFSMMGAPRQDEVKSPTISVTTFHSMENLCDIVKTLDGRFGRRLGVAIELPDHGAPEWHRLARTVGDGGRLAIVVPPQSRTTLPLLSASSEGPSRKGTSRMGPSIAGWDQTQHYVSVDQAVESLLSDRMKFDRCFILRPEWHDAGSVFAAIGRSIVACG